MSIHLGLAESICSWAGLRFNLIVNLCHKPGSILEKILNDIKRWLIYFKLSEKAK